MAELEWDCKKFCPWVQTLKYYVLPQTKLRFSINKYEDFNKYISIKKKTCIAQQGSRSSNLKCWHLLLCKRKFVSFGGQGSLGKAGRFVCVFAHSHICTHVQKHNGRLTGVKLAPENVDQKSAQSGKNGTSGRQNT